VDPLRVHLSPRRRWLVVDPQLGALRLRNPDRLQLLARDRVAACDRRLVGRWFPPGLRLRVHERQRQLDPIRIGVGNEMDRQI